MKKILTFIVLFGFAGLLKAQNESDVINLSQYFVGGTARGISLSGAYGALGGDLTSLSINPAGIGVYRSSELVITPTFSITNTESVFHSNAYTDTHNKFSLGNLGLVLTSNSRKEYGWISASFGFAYNKLIDFNKNITITAQNNQSSFLDEFLLNANNSNASQYYEDLAISTNAIFYLSNEGYYINDFKDYGYGQDQRRMINQKGSVGEYVFSLGANYSNMLFLGASFGVQSVSFSESKIHDESNIPGGQLNSFTFYDDFSYKGVGYNLKFGAIFKPIDFLRLGAAFHSPTWYNIDSDFGTEMTSRYTTPPLNNSNQTVFNDYSSILGYSFDVSTPSKIILSGALQHKLGIISFDYEFVNYKNSKIRADDDPFTDVNQSIQNNYRSTQNIKVGGELKIEQIALRAGYGFYGSPYGSNMFNKDANTQTYSAGLGYRGDNFFIDFGYILFNTKYKNRLYDYETPDGNNNWYVASEIADLETKSNRFVVTFGFRF